jgi:hypothetical protein
MSPYVRDMLQRVVFTFAFTFLSAFTITDLSTANGAAVAGGAAVLSLVKSWLAKHVGDPNTAGF